jgi:hypothetical protein
MDGAIAGLNSSATPYIAQITRNHGLSRSTLSRRWRGVTASKGQSVEDHRFLNDNQEQELKNYIETLCERCLPPPGEQDPPLIQGAFLRSLLNIGDCGPARCCLCPGGCDIGP